MKKFIIVLAVVLSVVAAAPQKAHASWWSNFVDWIRNAPASEVERIKNDGPTFTIPESAIPTRPIKIIPPTPATNVQPVNVSDTRVINGQSSTSGCGFSITSPRANSTVSFPLTISGTVDNTNGANSGCYWGMFEGIAGSAQLYFNYKNEGWKPLGVAAPINVANWTSAKTNFTTTIRFNNDGIGIPSATPIKLVFSDENAKDDDVRHTYELPLIFNNADNAEVKSCELNAYLSAGSTGPQVTYLQDFLIKNGFPVSDPSGTYGEPTKQAVIRYQIALGLPATGFVGPLTVARICGSGDKSRGVTISARTLSTSEDRAGAWNNFGPGSGNGNKNAADWNWILQLDGESSKTIKRITIISNNPGEVWSTGFSRYLSDGTDLYGRNEHPYPLVIATYPDKKQFNSKYDDSEFTSSRGINGVTGYVYMFGQKESTSFTGGTVIAEFTDGTTAKGTVSKYLCPADYTCVDALPVVPPTTSQSKLIAPNGSEVYNVGDTMNIKWNESSIQSTYVKLELAYSHTDPTYGAGTYFHDYIIESTPNSGSYNWIIPEYYATGAVKNSFKVKISSTAGVNDYSDSNFTINRGLNQPTLAVTSPSKGASYSYGSTVPITWVSTGKNAYSASLLRVSDPNFLRLSLSTTGYAPAMYWKVPTNIPAGNDYYIKVNEGPDRQSTGYSGIFSIGYTETVSPSPIPSATYPTPRMISPNGGENIQAGNSYIIKWYGGGNGEKIKFELISPNGTATWISSDIPLQSNPAYFSGLITPWQIPMVTPGPGYKIRITRQSDGVVLDETDGTFTIIPASTGVSVLNGPNETYVPGQTMTIRYLTYNYPSGTTFTLKLAKRALTVGSPIEAVSTIVSGQTSGTYGWRIPTGIAPANNYLILICPSNGGECGHSLVFTINPDPNASPSSSPGLGDMTMSTPRNMGLIGSVFYSVGDIFDHVLGW